MVNSFGVSTGEQRAVVFPKHESSLLDWLRPKTPIAGDQEPGI